MGHNWGFDGERSAFEYRALAKKNIKKEVTLGDIWGLVSQFFAGDIFMRANAPLCRDKVGREILVFVC